MNAKGPEGTSGSSEPTLGAAAEELPERWSVQRKTELILRLLRGAGLDVVSRESQVPALDEKRAAPGRSRSASARFCEYRYLKPAPP